ncbi:hypothetical protein PPACK8108_LOCUS17282 [Phakopsora pachyrhizi]|uniref:Uncharacterized protein n=1 Tax=Phakopsora pachyrhizi TaxID=170000 RepID=A0AAV0BBC7_PHAPC|nr:hypothetical protein PPACK8108_LOCUS17282 [Phakopsora pachyrhizi]
MQGHGHQEDRGDGFIGQCDEKRSVIRMVKGLWRGIFVLTYKFTKMSLIELIKSRGRSVHRIGNAEMEAVTASVVLTLLKAPFDYINTQLQFERIKRCSTTSRHTITTASELIRRVLGAHESQHGPRSIGIKRRSVEKLGLFFNGSGLRLIRKGISSAISWPIYEKLIKRWTTIPN